jgi:GTP-binding protein
MDLGDEDERRPTIADVPGPDRGRVERGRARPRVPAPRRADADPRPRRRRLVARPGWDHDVIRDELEAHDPALLEKPMLVVFNKLDRPAAAEAWASFRGARIAAHEDVVAISATERTGLPELRTRIAALLPNAEELGAPPEPAGVVVHRIDPADDGFTVDTDSDGALRVRGKRIERLAAQTNFEVEESAERFQRALARLGIEDELRRRGVEPGDTVRIGATELEWEAQPWEA